MNAALGISLMLFGHYMLPSGDDTTPKLNEDMSTPVTTQDDEQRYAQQHVRLPPAPTMAVPDASTLGRDGYRGDLSRYPTSTLPGATQNRSNGNSGMIPLPPTDPNAGYGGGALAQPRIGTPGSQPLQGYSGFQSNLVTNNGTTRGNQFSPNQGSNGVGRFSAPTAPLETGLTAPTLGNFAAPTTSQFISQGSNGTMSGNGYGTGVGGTSAGGSAGYGYQQNGGYPYGPTNTSVPDNRPFANANPLAPVFSPYLNLYNTPTSNGTVDPYHSAVLPALQQQAYNTQTTAQIQGVRTAPYRGLGPNGASGVQMGNGLAEPSQFINYGSSFNNTGNYFPVNPYGQ